jgi:excisionase family DNA binding protein
MVPTSTARAQSAPARYLTRKDAAKYTSLSVRLIDSLVAQGKLPACKPSRRRVVFDRADLDNYMAGCKT